MLIITTLENAEEADLDWWMQVSPADRVEGMQSALDDWAAMSGASLSKHYSDFEDLFRCLNEAQAHYLVIGGYAVGYHVGPRYTKDVDTVGCSTQPCRHPDPSGRTGFSVSLAAPE